MAPGKTGKGKIFEKKKMLAMDFMIFSVLVMLIWKIIFCVLN